MLDVLDMHARAVDEAAARLRELRREEREDLSLAALAIGLALAATQGFRDFVLPLFVGGLAVGVLGVRALWRHWDLVDALSGEPDAYAISEVRAYAAREATMDRRHSLAAYTRTWLREPIDERLVPAAEELEALARELDDDALAFDPACAVATARLLSDPDDSPLLNRELPQEELRSRIHQIRSGFEPRRAGASIRGEAEGGPPRHR